MHSDEGSEDDFFNEVQPSVSGLTLSHKNNKSSVLCPETQDITSQYLALQQLDAHQKMINRAKGCVDTTAPKSMQSFISVSSQRKKKLLKQLKSESQISFQSQHAEDYKRPNSSRLTTYNSEEDENESTNASFLNKGSQTGIPVPNITCKTAEKISWYLEALSLGELQSQYFAFLDSASSMSKEYGMKSLPGSKSKKIIKGDIMDWHREHFKVPRKPFSPRILGHSSAKSKVRDMRCYNPPFRIKKMNSSHSSETFESYEDDDDDEEISQKNEITKTSDNSSVEEETLINTRLPDANNLHYNSSAPLQPRYRRDYSNYPDPPTLCKTEEDKYLDFLSKVTEDILRSGVYSDKAIQQAFEFHLQFYKDDPNKEKLQSLLEQVLEGLKVTNDDENFQRSSFLFPCSRPSTPPEKESSAILCTNDTCKTATELNSELNGSVDNSNELNLNNS